MIFIQEKNPINKWMRKNNITTFRWEYTKKGVKVFNKIFYPKSSESNIELLKSSVIPYGRFCYTDDYRDLGCMFWKNNPKY